MQRSTGCLSSVPSGTLFPSLPRCVQEMGMHGPTQQTAQVSAFQLGLAIGISLLAGDQRAREGEGRSPILLIPSRLSQQGVSVSLPTTSLSPLHKGSLPSPLLNSSLTGTNTLPLVALTDPTCISVNSPFVKPLANDPA